VNLSDLGLRVFSVFLLATVLLNVRVTFGQRGTSGASKLDEFEDAGADDAESRLDRFAKELDDHSDLRGLIVGHRNSDSPRGSFLREIYGYRAYLTDSRGITSDRVTVVEGGFKDKWTTELWLFPKTEPAPATDSTRQFVQYLPIRFDQISSTQRGECIGEFTLELTQIKDALKLFAEALRDDSNSKAWIVVHPSTRETSIKVNAIISDSKRTLAAHAIAPQRILTAIGDRRSSICTDINLWLAPATSMKADEQGYYAQLIREAEQTEYTVRRVEFSGNVHIRDSTLRRGFLQQEGDVFSKSLVERSLRNFSRIAPVYPVTFTDVDVRLNREYKLVDLTIYFKERPKAGRRSRIR